MTIINSKICTMLLIAAALLVGCGTANNGAATGTTAPNTTTSNTAPGVTAIASGTAGSIALGMGTKINVVSPTQYSLPMSVQVVDSNGAAVSGAVVTLTTWPKYYRFGKWFAKDPVNAPNADCSPYFFLVAGSSLVPNEDLNKNLILDAGENVAQTATSIASIDAYGNPIFGAAFPTPANDGILTPYSASAGTFVQDATLQPITSVTTDASGTANFSLLYLKAYAPWIVAELKATTPVIGSQTTAVLETNLIYEITEGSSCALRNSLGGSPFNDPSW